MSAQIPSTFQDKLDDLRAKSYAASGYSRSRANPKLYEHSSLFRLVGWLNAQKTWDGKLRGGHMVKAIANILDLYRDHGPSYQLQTAFNSLASRKPKFGRVALRLRVRPVDERGGQSVLRSTGHRLTPEEKAEIKRSCESNSGEDMVRKFLSKLPPKATKQILNAYQPQLMGAVHNPLFDLWLTLLIPQAANRIRQCLHSDCQKYFVAWPSKKEFCSSTCRNRHWNRPRRIASGHNKSRKAPFRSRTR